MKKLVVVLGMHRSGTSMITQICQYMGAYLGEENELIAATRDNPDGYFEYSEIPRINDDILRLCNLEGYSLETPKPDYSCSQIIKAIDELKIIIQKLFEKSDTIAIKDPRISILLPLWKKIFDELEAEICYVWMLRNPLEVMESLRKREGYSKRHCLLLWLHYNLSILKFLKEKDYIQIYYRDVLENVQALEGLSQLFGRELDDSLKEELRQIVKHGYCHSNYSNQAVRNIGNDLVLEFYDVLLSSQEQSADVANWERRYRAEIIRREDGYIDDTVLKNAKCLREKEIIIYGAGTYGKQAAEMLQQLELKFDFCDRDVQKHGMTFMGGRVFKLSEIEERENLCVIIAIENEPIKKEIEETLLCIKNVSLFSFRGLKLIWKHFRDDNRPKMLI